MASSLQGFCLSGAYFSIYRALITISLVSTLCFSQLFDSTSVPPKLTAVCFTDRLLGIPFFKTMDAVNELPYAQEALVNSSNHNQRASSLSHLRFHNLGSFPEGLFLVHCHNV